MKRHSRKLSKGDSINNANSSIRADQRRISRMLSATGGHARAVINKSPDPSLERL